jgi:twitching motility protein PilT
MKFRVAILNAVEELGRTFFIRRLADSVPEFTDLGIPGRLCDWLLESGNSKGLVLFAGPQGVGKTTSANAYIKSRLTAHGGHAVTYEHPVELPLSGPHGQNGFCWQTDITSEAELQSYIEGTHGLSSPNVVFIGEIRSKYAATETLRAALGSSKQLVVATIHGTSISTALDRLLLGAQELDGLLAQHNLSQTLAAIVFQEIHFNESFGRRVLNTAFLLVPFDSRGAAIRAKLRKGDLFFDNEIEEQKRKFQFTGKF